jgi:putative flippase GtrA
LPNLTHLGRYRPARYLVVGGICALAQNAVMIAGDAFGGHFAALTVLSFALVTPLAYWLHTAFTFDKKRELRSFLRFAAGLATGFPLSLLVTGMLCSGLQAPMVVAAPITTVVLFFWNYCSAHWAILKGWRLRNSRRVIAKP